MSGCALSSAFRGLARRARARETEIEKERRSRSSDGQKLYTFGVLRSHATDHIRMFINSFAYRLNKLGEWSPFVLVPGAVSFRWARSPPPPPSSVDRAECSGAGAQRKWVTHLSGTSLPAYKMTMENTA
ncbi:hypothetical protein GWI33_005340 [Rhynchophorus ferrugineus]|uniref:Uncharacterized protein n=1 Tax=Rhynchophorus ferrugineus TaxID=354439 RepID=A0A834MKE4_RHYFE|nr:hypothetical protein GWI33_005340 [Rhynchophorus ferrugineus]